MEGVHRGWIRNCVKEVGPGGLGNFGPQYGLVQIPGRGSGGQSFSEAEAKREIKVQFLTCSCANFLINEQSLDRIFVQTHAQLRNSKY